MPPSPPPGQPPATQPTIVCLHHLGGSRHSWDAVAAHGTSRLHPIDLPGFGDAAAMPGAGVAAMADHVATGIAGIATPWLLAGHSMGAKVAAALARRAEDGDPGLAGLTGLILVAGSPPCPEPMDEARRTEMLAWFQDTAADSRAQAERFIAANTATPLPAPLQHQAIADLLRMNPQAWTEWLAHGSNEDWSHRIGTLRTPALILAGAEDGDLGPDAQRRLMAPHFANSRFLELPATKHLVPLEQPAALARLLVEHAAAAAPPA